MPPKAEGGVYLYDVYDIFYIDSGLPLDGFP